MRCSKKMKEYKSGSEAKPITKYKFYEQMQFLNKIVSHRPTETNMPSAETDVETAVKDDCSVPKKRGKKEVKEDPLNKRISNLLDSSEKEDNSRIMCFFKGIAPTIEKFCDADIVNFQYEVIKAMRNIQKKNMPQHSLQPQRNYYENNNSMTFQSQSLQIAQNNMNSNSYGGYRTTPSTSTTNYRENTLNESRQYETLHVRVPSSPTDEYSLGPSSIDSQHSSVSQSYNIDFDFAKSPGSYQYFLSYVLT
ncbi:unnamed protein product [Acanthoscelides obtectus]|uniref:BESS domain-containing protein n=2 Tax=Acanthoscelides obtectus TaxID=200917 RepID=A0A9P0LZL7_ACAOB|nr:unnamed protein product [Acanthoscelides obtectus]CAK1679573.1 hypothetical protein AOBTE_LOCUS32361 [Acanthoscelides obtectus]